MSQDQTLSGEEISALMSEARDSGSAGGGASAAAARAFSLGGDAGRTMAAIPALDRLNERMVKRLRAVIEPFARAKPRVETLPTEVRAFGDWRAEQSEFVSLSLYGFRPLKGAILLRIEPEFVSRLVVAFYGGNGTAPIRRAREFTATEEGLLGRLAEAVIGALAEVWQEVVPVRPLLKGRETNVGFADLAGADEAVAITRFDVAPWTGPGSGIEILYPVAALRPVRASKSSTRSPPCARSSPSSPQSRMTKAARAPATGASGSALPSARSASRRAPCSPVPNFRSPS
jgi:flagellar motor switch protein FliM